LDDKITIIEGPPPTFEEVNDGWALSLHESPSLSDIMVTRLRTFNGPALVERCYRTWKQHAAMHLEYRSMDGLPQTAPIVAARTVDVSDGQMLILWIVIENDEVHLEFGYNEDDDDTELPLDDDLGPSQD
jgi:hypothetical protein